MKLDLTRVINARDAEKYDCLVILYLNNHLVLLNFSQEIKLHP